MKIVGTSFAIWCAILGVIDANILDDIILNNRRDKEPVMKQSDPFYNPFGLPFSLFGDLSAEEPHFLDMTVPNVKVADGKESDVKVADAKTVPAKEVVKKSVDRTRKEKPWFSFSDFLSIPEMSRKRNHEGHKAEAALQDKISQTGDLAQTKTPIESEAKKSNSHDDDKGLIFTDEHKRLDDRDWTVKNGSKGKTLAKGFGSSFPKGLSDILIIFQKVGPKLTKTHSIVSTDAHTCSGLTCYNGMCEFKKSEAEPQAEPPKKQTSVLEHFDRLFLLVIPIVLGIGTVFFALELRRIYRKMKKQTLSHLHSNTANENLEGHITNS
uniref:Chromosome partition protein Smc n=1 Tax=Lygus hesperus TaxID=30085 RepID=A0A0A9W8M1_LYGHE